jgi:hypothetical protein
LLVCTERRYTLRTLYCVRPKILPQYMVVFGLTTPDGKRIIDRLKQA